MAILVNDGETVLLSNSTHRVSHLGTLICTSKILLYSSILETNKLPPPRVTYFIALLQQLQLARVSYPLMVKKSVSLSCSQIFDRALS